MLQCRHKDLAINKRELNEILGKRNAEELDDDVEEELETQARDKRVIIRIHVREIKKLEAQTTVNVNYVMTKTGYTAVLPPGLPSQPTFLSEPIYWLPKCWCPTNIPVTDRVEETTTMTEEMPLSITSARHTVASGIGLISCVPNEKSTFTITAKDNDGKTREIGGDKFVVESKDAIVEFSVVDKENGVYEVSYIPGDVKKGDLFILAVSLLGCPIIGSPFSVPVFDPLLLYVSSNEILTDDWLDEAVAKMANISRARL